ncbi:pre-rRNA processing protein [Neophaeococcomyces mojaviensis]|uniref:Pre-rRNA processing protein n=1 Tax=Neophaeococcomyces mojaviensis TaxID=3383035 RepID=A0ACC3A547_9EURO|nr:pre-rRNA processing protein [Knufia sp. JES_112]
MSSFFTTPASQRKRKRTDERTGKPSKRRDVERSTDRRIKNSEKPQPVRDTERDESISGSETEDEIDPAEVEESEATSEEDETAAERRVRLAQRYLDRIKGEADEVGFDAEDLDRDIIAKRLREDVDEAKGRQFRLIANTLDFENPDHVNFRADTQSTTAVAVCKPYLYTTSKDKTLIKWQILPPNRRHEVNGTLRNGHVGKRKPKQIAYVKGVKVRASAPQQHGHTGAILSVAASPDGKYVATGGADKKLIIWSAEDLRPLKTFFSHRDAVTGLDFAPAQSNQSGFGTQLFSASMDRSIKTYSLAGEDSIAYVETLFGHQDHVVGVSAMMVDQCVSVGARDRSARLWRVVDETQLKFLGDSSRHDEYQTGSLDCVAALPPQHFVTGSDSGAINLWSMHKKKALFTVQTAHGVDNLPPLEDVTSEADPKVIEELKKYDRRRPQPRAITALVALPGTDIVLSGSWDGWIRIWKLSDDKRSLVSLGVIGKPSGEPRVNDIANGEIDVLHNGNERGPIQGVVNALAAFERRKEIVDEFGGKKQGECQGLCVVAGTGKEMRLGRWMKSPNGRNGAVVFEIPLKSDISS